jgi:murein L,D-transpeptidase YcbB/YkuD
MLFMRRFCGMLLLLFVCAPLIAQTVEVPPATEGGKLIQSLITVARMEELRWPDFNDYRKHLRNFYAPISYALVWSRGGRVTPQARTIIALFEAADAKGINSVDYDGPRWRDRLAALERTPAEADLARFDLALSTSLMRYISDLHIGRINPRNVRFDLDIESKKYYLPKLLGDIAIASDPTTILNTIEPPYDGYRNLQTALANYRRLAADAAAEKPLPVVKMLKPGQPYAALPQLARMLRRVGDLPPDAKTDDKIYDETLAGAVRHFQERHGLQPDGVISERTFRALNVPLTFRVRQIEWALERWRWVPSEFETPPIIVNLPEFVLRAWDEHGKTALAMRVVVGQAFNHQTPVFADQMKYVVFRPYWYVTPTIQRAEIVPHVARNRSYLASNGYEMVNANDQPLGSSVDDAMLARLRTLDVSVRQKPGPSNSLGLIKFIFPNENNIYFHSTPSRELFSRTRRDFSHGCIRLQDPQGLAAWVLRDQPQWPVDRIHAAMESGPNDVHVKLTKPIPIMIVYATAVAQDDGDMHFYEDIYGHDATLENALAAGYPYPA